MWLLHRTRKARPRCGRPMKLVYDETVDGGRGLVCPECDKDPMRDPAAQKWIEGPLRPPAIVVNDLDRHGGGGDRAGRGRSAVGAGRRVEGDRSSADRRSHRCTRPAALSRALSQASVDLRLGDQFVDLIGEGVDVAIRVGDMEDSRLISRQLAPHSICAFAAPGYLARRGTPQRPEALTEHDCVNFRFQSSGQPSAGPS